MAQTRMPSGPYKKMLVRLPPDILEMLQKEAIKEERSVNGQLVYTLRQTLEEARDREFLAALANEK